MTILLKLSHSESSGGWEQRTKLSKKAALKFINITLTFVSTDVASKLMKLGSMEP